MTIHPLVSVIMPVRNADRYVGSAIASVLTQTFHNFELIIVDDASTDRSRRIIKTIRDKRIKLIQNKFQSGVAASLNKALNIARGGFIARMDADDISCPGRFEAQVKFLLKYPDIGIVGTWVDIIDRAGKILFAKKMPIVQSQIKKNVFFSDVLIHPSVMFRKSLITKYGYYEEAFNGAEDYDLWLRLASHTEIGNIPQVLFQYRLNSSGVSMGSRRFVIKSRIKVQIHAITHYHYPLWMILYALKSLVSLCMPSALLKYNTQNKKIQVCMLNKIYKYIVLLLKQSEKLSAVSCRLVQWTHKHEDPIHPKHLIKIRPPWYLSYIDSKSLVLDIGCNNGQHTMKIAEYCKQIFAFDYDSQVLKLAIKQARQSGYKNIHIKQADAESRLPYQSNKFHVVVFLDVLEHLNNRDKIIQEIYRVLKPEGLLLLSIPNRKTRWKLIQKNVGINYYSDPDHKIEYSKAEIKNFLKKYNFEVKNIFPVTLDTPLVGLIDLIGGISLTLYKYLSNWRRTAAQKYPEETIGYELVCVKK